MQMNLFHSPQAATLMTLNLLVGMHRPQQLPLMLCVGRLAPFAHVSAISKRTTRLNQLPVPLARKSQASNARLQVTSPDPVPHARASSLCSAMILAIVRLHL